MSVSEVDQDQAEAEARAKARESVRDRVTGLLNLAKSAGLQDFAIYVLNFEGNLIFSATDSNDQDAIAEAHSRACAVLDELPANKIGVTRYRRIHAGSLVVDLDKPGMKGIFGFVGVGGCEPSVAKELLLA